MCRERGERAWALARRARNISRENCIRWCERSSSPALHRLRDGISGCAARASIYRCQPQFTRASLSLSSTPFLSFLLYIPSRASLLYCSLFRSDFSIPFVAVLPRLPLSLSVLIYFSRILSRRERGVDSIVRAAEREVIGTSTTELVYTPLSFRISSCFSILYYIYTLFFSGFDFCRNDEVVLEERERGS